MITKLVKRSPAGTKIQNLSLCRWCSSVPKSFTPRSANPIGNPEQIRGCHGPAGKHNKEFNHANSMQRHRSPRYFSKLRWAAGCFPPNLPWTASYYGEVKAGPFAAGNGQNQSKDGGLENKLVYQSRRKVLVQSVLSSIPTYLLTVLKPPKGFLDDVDKARRKFLWAGD